MVEKCGEVEFASSPSPQASINLDLIATTAESTLAVELPPAGTPFRDSLSVQVSDRTLKNDPSLPAEGRQPGILLSPQRDRERER